MAQGTRPSRRRHGETEITDAESAVAIDEQVARLEIAVDDFGGMHVTDAPQDLSHKVLVVGIRERLTGTDDLGEIGFAGGEDEVNLGKVDKGGFKVEQGGDVVAHAEMTEESDLAKGSASEDILLKDARHLFDGDIALENLVSTESHAAVSADAELADKGIALLDVEGNAEAAERVVAASSEVVRRKRVVLVSVARCTVGA